MTAPLSVLDSDRLRGVASYSARIKVQQWQCPNTKCKACSQGHNLIARFKVSPRPVHAVLASESCGTSDSVVAWLTATLEDMHDMKRFNSVP